MTTEELRSTVAEDGRVYGTLISSTSPILATHLRNTGVDLVFMDTEHIPINPEVLSWMCIAYEALGLLPLVRILSANSHEAARMIDFGARGVVAPYVETVEEAKGLLGALKMRPLKGERLRSILDGASSPEPTLESYFEKYNNSPLVLLNIESVPAVKNLERILAVPGVDGILIGPHDLSVSLGIPEQYTNPQLTDAIKTVIDTARKKEMIAGVHFSMCGNNELAARWIKLGINLYIHHADMVFSSAGLSMDLNEIQSLLGEQRRFGGKKVII